MKLKMAVKTQALFNVLKSTIETVGEKYKDGEEIAKKTIEEKRLQIEEELKSNDKIIESLQEEENVLAEKIKDHQPSIEEQRRILEEEQRKLDALLEIKEEFQEEKRNVSKEIQKLREKQTKLTKENVKMFEELKELNRRKAADALSRGPFHEKEAAENIRVLMHKLANHEEYENLFDRNEKSLQYTFELVKGNKVQHTYYFTTSTDEGNANIHLYKEEKYDGTKPPRIARGNGRFAATDEKHEKEVAEVAILALKELKAMECTLN